MTDQYNPHDHGSQPEPLSLRHSRLYLPAGAATHLVHADPQWARIPIADLHTRCTFAARSVIVPVTATVPDMPAPEEKEAWLAQNPQPIEEMPAVAYFWVAACNGAQAWGFLAVPAMLAMTNLHNRLMPDACAVMQAVDWRLETPRTTRDDAQLLAEFAASGADGADLPDLPYLLLDELVLSGHAHVLTNMLVSRRWEQVRPKGWSAAAEIGNIPATGKQYHALDEFVAGGFENSGAGAITAAVLQAFGNWLSPLGAALTALTEVCGHADHNLAPDPVLMEEECTGAQRLLMIKSKALAAMITREALCMLSPDYALEFGERGEEHDGHEHEREQHEQHGQEPTLSASLEDELRALLADFE